MKFLNKTCTQIALVVIILLGAFLRFWRLDWGEGQFFHPDEYHIAGAVERLSFPSQMNPKLFSYGSLTVYLIYFTRQLLTNIHPILIGRFYSALFSTLTIFLVFLISQKLFKKDAHAHLAAFLAAVTPGLIQQAHFATPESNLTFYLFLTLYLLLTFLEKEKFKFLYLSAAALGLALGTKITALTFLPVLLGPPLLKFLSQPPKKSSDLIKILVPPLLITATVFFCVFPYSILDWKAFRSSMNYEVGVGRGEPIVFYTRQFINTIPVVFQLTKILPYALGPGLLILGVWGLGVMLRRVKNLKVLVVLLAFFSYFLPNAFLFAKWTRFIAPTFPFFAIFSVYSLTSLRRNFLPASYLLSLVTCCSSLLFFSIYLCSNTRVAANIWLTENLPSDSFILTEGGNMVEVPFSGGPPKKSFDFYHLEEKPYLQKQLPQLLFRADYFIIQSRRIFANHQRLPEQFPKTKRFYDLLFSGQLGFTPIKEFRPFPFFSDEFAEETWSVFDHPVIRVYKKTAPLTKEDYEKLLQI